MSRRISWKVIVPLVVVACALPFGIPLAQRQLRFLKLTRVVKAADVLPIPAFTLEVTEVIRASSKDPSREAAQLVIAQRSDGSHVERNTLYPGQPMEFTSRTIKLNTGMTQRFTSPADRCFKFEMI